MTPEAKIAAAVALPTVTWMSPEHGIAMGLGLLGGWLARVGLSVKDRKPRDEIWRDILVSLLISIGSIIATLFFAQLFEAGTLGIAAIGFAVAFAQVQAIDVLRNLILTPIINAIRNSGGRT